ncbi:MAG: TolC family protein, partial [Planctomycetes bacterium]|nr:TolC family protein [Planctomycetota bacterium]
FEAPDGPPRPEAPAPSGLRQTASPPRTVAEAAVYPGLPRVAQYPLPASVPPAVAAGPETYYGAHGPLLSPPARPAAAGAAAYYAAHGPLLPGTGAATAPVRAAGGTETSDRNTVPTRTAEATEKPAGAVLTRTAGTAADPKTKELPTGPGAPVPAPPADAETIDLGVALRLAGVDNPTINLAREQIREALAELLGARSLLLPSVNIGGNFHQHTGTLQASFGGIRKVNSQSLYLGFGARTLAAESVAFPGVRLFAHLGDAFYEPLAARQRVTARRSDAQAVQNDMLLRVTVAYLELVGAESRLEITRQGEVDIGELVRVTRVFAQKGQGRQGDADRAAARAELLRQDLRRTEEEVGVTTARLSELLNLDPSVRLRTPGGAVLPVRLIPEEAGADALVAEAVRARPELFARSAEIQEARTRVRQEQVRPFVPLLSVGYSGGLFGGGSNLVDSRFGPMKGRTDFDVFAVWNVQNLGFGNRALVRRADARFGEALAAFDLDLNRVRREVHEALADARAAARQIEVSKSSVAVAEEGFKLEKERIALGQGRPIEALDSFQQLLDARRELVRAVIDFNVAQFRLYVAVGSNPLAAPGAPEPVLPAP